jgi:hypothetical protein
MALSRFTRPQDVSEPCSGAAYIRCAAEKWILRYVLPKDVKTLGFDVSRSLIQCTCWTATHSVTRSRGDDLRYNNSRGRPPCKQSLRLAARLVVDARLNERRERHHSHTLRTADWVPLLADKGLQLA